jgi:hypothetical protein
MDKETQTHTHDETGEPHTHDTDVGHPETTDTAGVRETDAPVRAVVGPGTGTIAGRVIFTTLGAVGMIVGAFLDWFGGDRGTDLSYRVFFQPVRDIGPGLTPLEINEQAFLTSAGSVVIAIAVLALVGLAGSWITRLAGALGVAAFVLFAISVYRTETASSFLDSMEIGAWLVLIGSVITLIGGFVGTRRVVALPE